MARFRFAAGREKKVVVVRIEGEREERQDEDKGAGGQASAGVDEDFSEAFGGVVVVAVDIVSAQ